MTPGARIAAAIEILETALGGAPVESLLTGWARRNRYAGAKDRAAIRDHVFDAWRCRRSFAALGGSIDGAATGRGLMLGATRDAGSDAGEFFTGEGYAPPPLSPAESAISTTRDALPQDVALDCPDWLMPVLQDSLGAEFEPVLEALRHRAPVFLRVNLQRGNRADAQAALAAGGIATAPHPLSPTALEVLENPRRLRGSQAYLAGLVELQDAGSQAITDLLPLDGAPRVLDLCAGGGGKSLAIAGRSEARIFAHDAAPERMRDLPARAARAGAQVTLIGDEGPEALAPFDLVLCDVPCSGSGAWRRSPGGKWRLTPEMLADMTRQQAQILDRAATLTAPGGRLAYATCSLIEAENGAQITAFLDRTPGWSRLATRRLTPLDGGDGFHIDLLQRLN